MRGLWTQASRPRHTGSHHLSSLDSLCSTLIRKTTTRSPRRRQRFCEHVFTVLLTPVLAAALFVDTSWKAKQRRDWDERLATINDEIYELRQREQQLHTSLQIRKLHHGLYGQRRGYATAGAAASAVEEGTLERNFEMPAWEDDVSVDQWDRPSPEADTQRESSRSDFSPEQLSDFTRYHRLNAIILALRMLLQVRIGASPHYSISPEDDQLDIAILENLGDPGEVRLPTDTDRLVQMLALSRKQIRPLYREQDLFRAAGLVQEAASRSPLQNTILALTTDFDEGKMSLLELIDGYGKAILQSEAVPSLGVYIMLIRSLSKVGSHSLAYLATSALQTSTLPLSDQAMIYMILQMAIASDSRSMNALLSRVASTAQPLNLMHKWEMVRIHGLDLPTPASLNPRMLMVLTYAALRCNQPDRAEAWTTLLREADYGNTWKDDVFRSFLAHYGNHRNWEQGTKWLKLSVDHAVSIANQSIDRLARVIYRMLDFCVRCRKLAEYTTILDAAVDSGIGPPPDTRSPNDHRTLHPRTRGILLEWETIPLPEDATQCTVESKAKSFQYACKALIEELSENSQTSRKEQGRDDDDGRVLMSSKGFDFQQRYAVRRRPGGEPTDHSGLAGKQFEALQEKLAAQDTLLSEMRARLDLNILHQKTYEADFAKRTRFLADGAAKLGQRFGEVSNVLEWLKVQSAEQDLELKRLKFRLEFAVGHLELLNGDTPELAKRNTSLAEQLRQIQEALERLRQNNNVHRRESYETRLQIERLDTMLEATPPRVPLEEPPTSLLWKHAQPTPLISPRIGYTLSGKRVTPRKIAPRDDRSADSIRIQDRKIEESEP